MAASELEPQPHCSHQPPPSPKPRGKSPGDHPARPQHKHYHVVHLDLSDKLSEIMAVFRKILSATKNKIRAPDLKIQAEKGGASTSFEPSQQDEEFERRKQAWQDELEEMSEFLLIKSAAEQKEEGAEVPVDTAFIEEKDGLPVLKALFDVHHFRPEDITIDVNESELYLQAKTTEDKDDRAYTKTMLRKIALPEQVDPRNMQCEISKEGLLVIEMPFHLPPQRKPQGPNVFPILTDAEGRRKIRLVVFIGTEFTNDDVNVQNNGHLLSVHAAYDAELGKYGQQVSQREFKRDYVLPDFVEVDRVTSTLSPDGRLFIEILLKEESLLKVEMTSEELELS